MIHNRKGYPLFENIFLSTIPADNVKVSKVSFLLEICTICMGTATKYWISTFFVHWFCTYFHDGHLVVLKAMLSNKKSWFIKRKYRQGRLRAFSGVRVFFWSNVVRQVWCIITKEVWTGCVVQENLCWNFYHSKSIRRPLLFMLPLDRRSRWLQPRNTLQRQVCSVGLIN